MGSTNEDLYAASGYGGRAIGLGARPGVLVIDLQKAVTDPRSTMGRSPMIADAVDGTVRLLETAREAGWPVVGCVTAFQPDLRDRPPWKVEAVDDWIEGSWHAELDERVEDLIDVCVVKKAPSIFFGTPVASILVAHQVDTVIVTGANTSGCIRASAIESFSYGFRTIVPRECVGDQGEEPHRQNLLDLDRRYADVVSLEHLLAELKPVGA